jgi:hypothetical protein
MAIDNIQLSYHTNTSIEVPGMVLLILTWLEPTIAGREPVTR